MKTHPFDKIQLTSYFLGDADNLLTQDISEHVKVCPTCKNYIDSLDVEKSVFLQTMPFEKIVASDKTPATTLRFRKTSYFYNIAALLLVFMTAGYFFMQRSEPSSRIKGEVSLNLFVKNKSGTIEKRPAQKYFPGEKIQFLYSCGSQNNFLLLSIDTSGTLSQYYPAIGDSSTALEPGQDVPLPNSILLDNYVGKELFIGIFSEKPMDCHSIKTAFKASFSPSRSLDSIHINSAAYTVVTYRLTVEPGTQK